MGAELGRIGLRCKGGHREARGEGSGAGWVLAAGKRCWIVLCEANHGWSGYVSLIQQVPSGTLCA